MIGLLFSLCIILLCFIYLKDSENYEIDLPFMQEQGSVCYQIFLHCSISKRCKKASDIITINAKPVGPEFSKRRMPLSKIKQLVLKHNSISLCISIKLSFICFRKSSMSLFNISIITATALSIGTDRYTFSTSKEVYISLQAISHSFASSTNEDEFKTLCLFLFKVGCIILTKYFKVPYGGDPIVDTTALIG